MKDLCYRVELNVIGTVITEPYVPTIVPKEELAGPKASLMQFERGEANASEADFVIVAEPEIKAFFTAYPDHEKITVAIWEYDYWKPSDERRVFSGRFDAPPVVVIAPDATTYYCRAVGWLATYNEVELKDPIAAAGPYRDVYVKRLVDSALAAADHRGGARIEIAEIDAAENYCARVFYPGAHKFGGAYNTTDKVQALCWAGSLLYLGVGRWLCSFDPETREKLRVAELRYKGNKSWLKALNPNEWRLRELEYSGGTVYGWAETTWDSLRDMQAHVKIKFTWAGGAIINLTDANLIYNYNRGYYVKSTSLIYANYSKSPCGKKHYRGPFEAIGEAVMPPNKDLGVMLIANGSWLQTQNAVKWGVNKFKTIFHHGATPPTKIPPVYVNDIALIHETLVPFAWQGLGRVMWCKLHVIYEPTTGLWTGWWDIETEYRTEYYFQAFSAMCFWRPTEAMPKPNLMLPGHRDLKIEYRQYQGIASPAPSKVQVERRDRKEGRKSFYFPEVLGDVETGKTLGVRGPLVALGSTHAAEEYAKVGDDTYWGGPKAAIFNVFVEDPARFSTLPIDGYWIGNDKQREDRTEKPGHNRLVHNGVTCTEGGLPLETAGNIFLAKAGNKIYVAWNRWRRLEEDKWFLQLAWGRVNGNVVTVLGRDRTKDNYQSRPPRELTSFAVHNGRLYFGVNRTEPRWVNTPIKIIYASHPDMGDKPDNYEGQLVAVFLVLYDKTKYLKEGTLIRVGPENKPSDKEYLISEVETIFREIKTTEFSSQTYGSEKMTCVKVHSLDPYLPGKYAEQAKHELLDKYITFQQTFDVKGEICYAGADELKVSRTATAKYGEAFEGDLYDWKKLDWKGEEVNPQVDGRYVTATLSEPQVIKNTVEVMLKEGHVPFTVVDKTDEATWFIPPLGECFIRRQEGNDYDETKIIFNPVYEGMAFDVNYETYVERFYVAPFVFKGKLYFNETGSAALYRRLTDTSWERIDSWPEAPVAVAVAGDDVYALSENSTLMRYGKRWPGYILGPVGGDDKVDVFSVIAEAAFAADCYVGEEGGTLVVSPRLKRAPVKVPTIRMFINSEVKRPTAYKAVKVIYDGGVAFVGPYETPEDNVCVVNVSLVSAYGHALQLAQRYHDFYQRGVIYSMRLKHDAVLNLKIGQALQVDTIKGRLLSWEIAGDEVAITQETSERVLASPNIPIARGKEA